MPYYYVPERANYADFAAGSVLLSAPGRTAFPVRLADEIFQRCVTHLPGSSDRVVLYDPCCGSGYLLAALGLLHGERLRAVIGSDIDTDALTLAARNLALLTPAGMAGRMAEIAALYARYGKPSHADALASASRFRVHLAAHVDAGPPVTHLFRADAMDVSALGASLKAGAVDLVITDVPYGALSTWQTMQPRPRAPLWHLLDALRPVLAPGAVVAVVSDKSQHAAHEAYARVEPFGVGKRRVTVLRVADHM